MLCKQTSFLTLIRTNKLGRCFWNVVKIKWRGSGHLVGISLGNVCLLQPQGKESLWFSSRHSAELPGCRMGAEMSTPITLSPPPAPYKETRDFEAIEATVSNTVEVLGFLTIADVASPPVLSRHLILPAASGTEEENRQDLYFVKQLCLWANWQLQLESLGLQKHSESLRLLARRPEAGEPLRARQGGRRLVRHHLPAQ